MFRVSKNVDWMKRFVDPDMRYHATIAKIWASLTVYLADAIVLPFNLERYGESLVSKMEEFQPIAKSEVSLGESQSCCCHLYGSFRMKPCHLADPFYSPAKI